MLILLLTLAFLFVCLVSLAAAFVSFVCNWIYYVRVSLHLRRTKPQWLDELATDFRFNPIRLALAQLSEAGNSDDQRVRLYADRARMWGWYAAFAWALAGVSGLILCLLNLGQ